MNFKKKLDRKQIIHFFGVSYTLALTHTLSHHIHCLKSLNVFEKKASKRPTKTHFAIENYLRTRILLHRHRWQNFADDYNFLFRFRLVRFSTNIFQFYSLFNSISFLLVNQTKKTKDIIFVLCVNTWMCV